MTDELSTLLRRAVKRGNVSSLSVISPDGTMFKAAWRGVDHEDHRIVESPDIVDALVCAITGRKPMAPAVVAQTKAPRKKVKAPVAQSNDGGFDDILG